MLSAAQQTLFNQALALHQTGQLGPARDIYARLLDQTPGHADVLRLLGTVESQLGNAEAGVGLLARSLAVAPDQPDAWYNRASVLQSLGRFSESVADYDKALDLRATSVDAWFGRGNALFALGRLGEAASSYGRALALRPEFANGWHNLGVVLLEAGQLDAALDSFDKALAANPGHVQAHHNRGRTQAGLGRHADALASYDLALALDPGHAEAHANRGNALQMLRRFDEALASFDRALAIRPDFAEAFFNRGNALRDLRRDADALASYDRSLELKPGFAEGHFNRGACLQAAGRPEEALFSYDQALALNPNLVEAYNNRAVILQALYRFDEALADHDRALALNPAHFEAWTNRGNINLFLGRYEEALRNYEQALALNPDGDWLPGMVLHAMMQLADWSQFDARREQLVLLLSQGKKASAPLPLLSLLDAPTLQLSNAGLYADFMVPAERALPEAASLPVHDRIRIGYFSSDFRDHPVGQLVAGLFERHDRERFEIFAFALGPGTDDDWRQRIRTGVDRFIDVALKSDAEVAALARSLEIDIAVDLNGFTDGSRLAIFAERAAPIQVGHIGYAGTMGTGWFDYLIADATLVPVDNQRHYAETIAYVPTYQINDDRLTVADTVFSREELGLPPSGFVFCAFNQVHKITPDVFGGWMRILRQVPDSVLWLTVRTPVAVANLKAEAARRGIDPDRLVFADRVPRVEDHLARHRVAGLFLDTFPYNAMVTASNALRAGLPVLTRQGESFASRMASSLLNAVGLPELITDTPEAYEALAVQLATHPEELAALRQKLADNLPGCALFDTEKSTRDLEAAYIDMYRHRRTGP